jgi:ABC-type antimicrobial peptide transport system permease subunit
VASVDVNVPLARVRTLETITGESMSGTSFALSMLLIAAAAALLLGLVGIYGVVSYVAMQRTREVGIRVALGAEPGQVTALFLRQGAVLAASGVGVGLGAALGLSRLMGSLLFGVSPFDPATYGAVSVLLMVVTLAAGYLPSRRAARLDPVKALRSSL